MPKLRTILLTAAAGAGVAIAIDPERRDKLRKQVMSIAGESSDDVVARISKQREEAVAAAQAELRANRAAAGETA
jgi:hypothetical protein